MKDNPRSTVFGYVLMTIGCAPSVLWVLDYVGLIRPDSDPLDWSIILVTVAFLSMGMLLVKGEGDSISEAFLSWFGKRNE